MNIRIRIVYTYCMYVYVVYTYTYCIHVNMYVVPLVTLENTNSSGFGNISNKTIKNIKHILIASLVLIFNQRLTKRVIPLITAILLKSNHYIKKKWFTYV